MMHDEMLWLQFDRPRLEQTLEAVSPSHRVAFAAACCERLLPNYQAFAQMERWGEPQLLRVCLERVWDWLDGRFEALSEGQADELARACESAAPDQQHFTSLYTSQALDAAAAVSYTLECRRDGKARWAGAVASSAVYSLEMYLNAVGRPIATEPEGGTAFAAWVWHSPLMQAELARQRQDLLALGHRPALDPDFLAELRRSSETMGLQPFARGVVKEMLAEESGQGRLGG